MPDILVAGHICLDLIPEITSREEWTPGRLVNAGPMTMSTGGAVANVGRALERLGQSTRLVARVGDDLLGDAIRAILERERPGLSGNLGRANSTSYTVVLSPPAQDRTFLHHPGGNDEFGPEDITDSILAGASHFHFGYPPLMARMFREPDALASIFRKAKSAGLSTSLDLSLPDRDSESGRTNWIGILGETLPYVDLFLPSEDELAFVYQDSEPAFHGELIVKCGAKGLRHKGRKIPCFPANVVGTTGSGDATIAGILYGYVRGWPLAECLVAGCAVGAVSTESADASSAIPRWQAVADRFRLPNPARAER